MNCPFNPTNGTKICSSLVRYSLIKKAYYEIRDIGKMVKDRQQEAEPDSRYLILFCNYLMHNNILYTKLKVFFFYT